MSTNWKQMFERALANAENQDWEKALADSAEALRLAESGPGNSERNLVNLKHFHLHVVHDHAVSKGSEEGETRETIKLFTDNNFEDSHYDWQVENLTRDGDLLCAQFHPNDGSITRWIVFKVTSPKALMSFAWFDLKDGAMQLLQQDPRADADEMFAFVKRSASASSTTPVDPEAKSKKPWWRFW